MNRITISLIYFCIIGFPYFTCHSQTGQGLSAASMTERYDLIDSIAQMPTNSACVDALGRLVSTSEPDVSHFYAEAAYALAVQLEDSVRMKKGLLWLAHAALDQKNTQAAKNALDRFFSGNIAYVNDSTLAWAWTERSRQLAAQKEREASIDAIEHAERFANATFHQLLAIDIQLYKGLFLNRQYDHALAYNTYKDMFDRGGAALDVDRRFKILHGLTRTSIIWNKLDLAIQWADSLMAFSKETGHVKAWGYGCITKGRVARRKGDYESAKRWLKESINFNIRQKDSLAIGDNYNSLGITYQIIGEMDSAIWCHEQALNLRLAISDTIGIIDSYINLGLVTRYRHQYDKAVAYLKGALAIVDKRPDTPNLAAIYANLGSIYFEKKDMTWSDFYYRKALANHRIRQDSFGIALSLSNLAQVYDKNNQLDSARSYILRSNKVAEKLGIKRILGTNYYNLAVMEAEKGLDGDGIEHAKRALAIAEESDRKVILDAHHLLAAAYQKEGNIPASIHHGKKALEGAEKIKNPQKIAKAAKILAGSYRLGGNKEKAYEYLSQAMTIEDSLQDESLLQELQTLNLEYKDSLLLQQKQLLTQENAILLKQDEIRELELEKKEGIITTLGIGLMIVLISLGFAFYQYRKAKQANVFLRESQLLQAEAETHKNRLVKLLMHDLKAPLSLIRSAFFLLGLEKSEEGSEINSLLMDGQEACERIFQMSLQAGQLSSASIPNLMSPAHDIEWVTPPEILEQITTEFSPLAKNFQVSLEVHAQDKKVKAMGNPLIIRHILGNLVHNALKFSKKGTKVMIDFKEELDRIIFNVKDNGPGISPDVQSHIFELDERGVTGQPAHGLALSNKLAASLGATISFETQMGEGTVFQLSIPKK